MSGLSKRKLYLVAGVAFGTFVPVMGEAATASVSSAQKHYRVTADKKATTPRTATPAALRASSHPEEIHVGGHQTNSIFSPGAARHSTTQVTVVTGAELLKTGQTNVLSALAQANPAITTAALPGGGASSLSRPISSPVSHQMVRGSS